MIRPRAHPPPFVYVTCRSTWPEHGARARNEHHNPPHRLPYPPLALALALALHFFPKPLCCARPLPYSPTYPAKRIPAHTSLRGRPCTPELSTQPLAQRPASAVIAAHGRRGSVYFPDHPASSTSRSLLSSGTTPALVEAALAAGNKDPRSERASRST